MNLETEELLLKRRMADVAYRHPNIRFPNFRFTSQSVKFKRGIWQIIYNLLGVSDFHPMVFKLLKKILKHYSKEYDLITGEVIKIIEMIYRGLRRNQLNELNKVFDDFLHINKFDKEKLLVVNLAKLKYHYLERLASATTSEDIVYLQGLIYKKNFIKHPRFHFLSIRFQASVRKYFGEETFETPASFLQEYINKGIDVRFLRVYLKVLKASKRHYEAIFLIQNLMMEFEGTDECYYYTKQCLKLCQSTSSDIPDIFWKNFSLYYTKSKTICEFLIDYYLKDKTALESHMDSFRENIVSVLTNARATKKIWNFVEKNVCSSKKKKILEDKDIQQIVRFQLRASIEKALKNELDSFDIWLMGKLALIAKAFKMKTERAFFEAAVKKHKSKVRR
jgi:hypothetical protein